MNDSIISEHQKKKQSQNVKKNCNLCKYMKVVSVECSLCDNVCCYECFHTFHVKAYKYLKSERSYYFSTGCGSCMEVVLRNKDEFEKELTDQRKEKDEEPLLKIV